MADDDTEERRDLRAARSVNPVSWVADDDIGYGLLNAAKFIIANRVNRTFCMTKVSDTDQGRSMVESEVRREWQRIIDQNAVFFDLPPLIVSFSGRSPSTPILYWGMKVD